MAFEYTSNETLLKIKDVSLTLGGRLILRQVNAEINNIVRPGHTQGQVVGFLGPSGVGKTQLFRIIAGLQQPDSGSVLLPGDKPVQRGQVGVVAQHYPLFEHRTVMGNLLTAGRHGGLGLREAKDKATGYLEKFGLTEHGKVYPSQLSGGQRQRAAIAQQLMSSSYLLLMDEPFSGLDVIMIDRVCELILELSHLDELSTIIVVTHDVDAAVSVSDTLWLMGRDRDEKGQVIPGARIQTTYNLIERGLAWREKIELTPEFADVTREVKERFLWL